MQIAAHMFVFDGEEDGNRQDDADKSGGEARQAAGSVICKVMMRSGENLVPYIDIL